MPEQQQEQPAASLPGREGEAFFAAEKKKLWLAYLLAVPLGWLGAHRLYLGRRASGVAMLAISLTALLITAVVVALKPNMLAALIWDAVAGLLLLITLTWEIVDFFLIPFVLRRCNRKLEAALKQKPRASQTV